MNSMETQRGVGQNMMRLLCKSSLIHHGRYKETGVESQEINIEK